MRNLVVGAQQTMNCQKLLLRDCRHLLFGATLYTLAFPPYDWSWLAWFALAPLFFILRAATPTYAFVVGMSYGVFWCIGQGSWLVWTMTAHFSLSLPLTLIFLLANFLFFSGLPIGVAASLSCVLMQRSSPLIATLGIPALWVSSEVLRANPSFGIPWGILGYTQYHHPLLIQIADITSVYGVSFLLALSGYTVAELWRFLLTYKERQLVKDNRQRGKKEPHNSRPWTRDSHSQLPVPRLQPLAPSLPWPAIGVFLGSLTVTLSYGAVQLQRYHAPESAAPLRVAIIQGDVPTSHRWQPLYYASTLIKYASVTNRGLAGAPADLAVWPEFAISFYLEQEPLLQDQIGQLASMLRTPLLLGAPRLQTSDTRTDYYNSAYFFSSAGQLIDVYDKLRLVPFAEYRPFSLPSLLPHSPEAPSEFTPGTRATVFPLGDNSFGVTICYEAAYPALSRRLAQEGAQFLVNISNDTWLSGTPAATQQHLAMNVLRAVENKRTLVRAATNGVSGFVEPTGRIVQSSTAREVVLQEQVFPHREVTFYTRWGDWFSYLCGSFTLLSVLQVMWRQRELSFQANPSLKHREQPRAMGEAA